MSDAREIATGATETTATGPVPRSARPGVLVGVRVVAGVVGIAVAAATIVAASWLPLPSIRSNAPSVDVTPVPTAQQRVCPGGILRLGDESGKDVTTVTAVGGATMRYRSTVGNVDTSVLQQSDAATAVERSAPLLISAAPSGDAAGDAVLLAGAQSQVANAGEFAGFAAAECAGAGTESWLVGGSSEVGRTTLLTLSNPTDVVAEVSFELFGEEGLVSTPGSTGIIVQARSQRVLPLAAFAPGLASPVIRVTSSGGQVVASVQQSIVRGLAAGGIDLVGATAVPARRQVIPGVVVRGVAELEGRLSETGYGDLATVARVFNPGAATTATVSIVSEDGAASGVSFETRLEAERVTDVSIDGLVDGSYTLTISAESAIVAGVRTSTIDPQTEGARSDFAWLAAPTRLGDEALVTVADGPTAQLHFSNPTASAVEVLVTASDDTTRTVRVGARSSAVTDVASGRTYRISGFTELYASVSFAGSGSLAGYVVQPAALASGELTVYP